MSEKSSVLGKLGQFFIERNKIRPFVVQGRNYDVLSLSRMLKAHMTDEVIRRIVSYVSNSNVYDFNAGIGAMTISLASNPEVKSVISFEKDERTRMLLKNNVEDYKLGEKVTILENFVDVKEEKNCVIYLDAMWEKEKFRGLTLEEFVLKYYECSLVVVRVSSEFTFDMKKLEKSFDFTLLNLREQGDFYFFMPKRRIFEIIKEPNRYEKWYDRLKQFLLKTLQLFLDEEMSNSLIDENGIKHWINAFTHKSFDVEENYEVLERLGDTILKTTFLKFITTKYPEIKQPHVLTALDSFYLAKKQLSELSLKFQFNQYVRVGRLIQPDIHMNEDLFEAFLGALWQSGDDVIGQGMGYSMCYNFILYIFEKKEIDFEVVKGTYRAQLKEWFEKLNWKMGYKDELTEDGMVNLIIFLPKNVVEFYRKDVPRISSIIGSGISSTKKVSWELASKQALENLNKLLGLTIDKVDEYHQKNLFQDPEMSKLYKPLKKKLEEDGYVKFLFQSIKTTRKGHIINLIGVNKSGEKRILASGEGNIPPLARKNAILEYLKN